MMAEALMVSMREGDVDAPEHFHLDQHTLPAELRDMFATLWTSKGFSDLMLKVQGRSFKTHKLLLVAHSEYFRKVDDLNITTEMTLDLDPDVFQTILQYLYLGKLDLTLPDLAQINRAAEFLGIRALQTQCQHVLYKNAPVTPDNCLVIMQVASEVNDQPLLTRAMTTALDFLQRLVHEPSFKQLPYECVVEYLTHPDLKVLIPDERVTACLGWVRGDAKARAKYLSSMLDLLPIINLQDWYIEQILRDPLIADSAELKEKIQAIRQRAMQNGRGAGCGHSFEEANTRQTAGRRGMLSPCLIIVGAVAMQSGKKMTASQHAQLHYLDDLTKSTVNLGPLNVVVNTGVKISAQGNKLYVSGVGQHGDEVWEYTVTFEKIQQSRKLGTMGSMRQGHGMLIVRDKLFMVGGYTGDTEAAGTIEMWDIAKQNTKETIGSLIHSSVTGNKRFYNMSCCYSREQNSLIIFGAFLTGTYKHTIQVFSLDSRKTTHTLVIPWHQATFVLKVMPVCGKFLLMAGLYTATCTWADIVRNKTENIHFLNKYTVPNMWCAAFLSNDGKNVILYGGCVKRDPGYSIYTAPVENILCNTGPGWTPVHTSWPVVNSCITGYDTMQL